MGKVDGWLDDHIDDIYHLNNEQIYLSGIGVRGHRSVLKEKAKTYLFKVA